MRKYQCFYSWNFRTTQRDYFRALFFIESFPSRVLMFFYWGHIPLGKLIFCKLKPAHLALWIRNQFLFGISHYSYHYRYNSKTEIFMKFWLKKSLVFLGNFRFSNLVHIWESFKRVFVLAIIENYYWNYPFFIHKSHQS